MKRDRKRQANHLLDEIGQIDDRYLVEAMNWRASGTAPRKKPIRMLLAAASLTLVLVLAFSATVSMFNRRKADGDAPPEGIEPPTLSDLLQNCTESGNFTPISADGPDFFDGEVRVAVKNVSTGELFVSRALTEDEQTGLEQEFKRKGTPVSPDADTADEFRVWVMLGDGSVVTPCLTRSAGNIGIADFFDYGIEREPTQIFMNLLSDLV